MGGFAIAGAMVASAALYTGTRLLTSAFTVAQAFITAGAQIKTLEWMIGKQQDMWDHVAKKQIACVEVALDEFSKSVESLIPSFKGAYPDVPVAARFGRVNPEEVHFNTMMENIRNVPKSAEYIQSANHWHRINYMARVELLSPEFTIFFDRHMRQIGQMLNAQLPVDELIGVTTDVAENAAALGKIGNTRMASSTALGIRRLQIQQLGRNELGRRIQWMDQIAPVNSEITIDQLMVKPERQLLFALEQAQLLQNDLQNANNAAAQKAPHKMAELQTKLQRVVATLSFNANKANMQNQFVPNFPGLFGPTISNLTQQVGRALDWDHDRDTSGQKQDDIPITSGN